MTPIEVMTQWNCQVSSVIQALGSDQLPQALSQAIESLIFDVSMVVFFIPKNQPPKCLFDSYPQRLSQVNTKGWLAGAYLLDPFYIKCFDGAPEGLYHLLELVPKGFLASEYYQLYYSRTQCTDEVCFIAQPQPDLRISLSIARIKGDKRFTQTELQWLNALSALVLALLNKQFQSAQVHDNPSQIKLHQQLQMGLKNFGKSILTAREQDMIQMILLGYSSKAIAQRLNISFDTVKMHRKNAYAKLNISSQAELFSLVFESLPYIEASFDDNADPLALRLKLDER